tara:strand:+ start:60 stop:284 length:225 start_codon:yes stop_codon:yes gene_type:complete
MSHVEVSNLKVIVPEDGETADWFIGLWVKAQNKAIAKVQDEFIFFDYTPDEFDFHVDKYTVEYYKQLKLEVKCL